MTEPQLPHAPRSLRRAFRIGDPRILLHAMPQRTCHILVYRLYDATPSAGTLTWRGCGPGMRPPSSAATARRSACRHPAHRPQMDYAGYAGGADLTILQYPLWFPWRSAFDYQRRDHLLVSRRYAPALAAKRRTRPPETSQTAPTRRSTPTSPSQTAPSSPPAQRSLRLPCRPAAWRR